MTDSILARYREVLTSKQAELEPELRRLDIIAVECVSEEMEAAQLAGVRELATGNLDRVTGLLNDVRQALGRIHAGEYGTCQICGDEINPKRLEAVPWTAYCLACQASADENQCEWTGRGC